MCRRMSCPVYEEEYLGNFPAARHCAWLPFPPPTRPAEHQVSLDEQDMQTSILCLFHSTTDVPETPDCQLARCSTEQVSSGTHFWD